MVAKMEPPWSVTAKKGLSKTKRAKGTFATNPALQHDWPEPESSIGDQEPNIGTQSCWQVRGPALEAWNQIQPNIKSFLNDHSETIAVSAVLWTIRMIGASKITALPTILICCEDAIICKEAWKAIRDSDILHKFPGIRLARLPRCPTTADRLVAMASRQPGNISMERNAPSRERNVRTWNNDARYSTSTRFRTSGVSADARRFRSHRHHQNGPYEDSDSESGIEMESFYSEGIQHNVRGTGVAGVVGSAAPAFHILSSSKRLVPGQAVQVSSISDHDRAIETTIGGAIRINSGLYLMTAAHPFRHRRPPVPAPVAHAEMELRYSDSEDEEPEHTHTNILSSKAGHKLPIQSSTMQSASRSPESLFEQARLGSENNVSMLPVSLIDQTQPSSTSNSAIQREVNADTFVVGTLWFIRDENFLPDLDYALVKLAMDASYAGPIVNVFDVLNRGFTSHLQFQNHPHGPVKSIVASAKGQMLNGQIVPAAVLLQSPCSRRYQDMFEVRFDAPLQQGDCGAWVTDPTSNKVHGHIVAGFPRDGIAYIVPFYQVIEDLRSAIGIHRHQLNDVDTHSQGYVSVYRSFQNVNQEVNRVLDNAHLREAIDHMEGRVSRLNQSSSILSKPDEQSTETGSSSELSQGYSRPLRDWALRRLNEERSPRSNMYQMLHTNQRSGPYDAIGHVSGRSDYDSPRLHGSRVSTRPYGRVFEAESDYEQGSLPDRQYDYY